jgi:hypothetical protein
MRTANFNHKTDKSDNTHAASHGMNACPYFWTSQRAMPQAGSTCRKADCQLPTRFSASQSRVQNHREARFFLYPA